MYNCIEQRWNSAWLLIIECILNAQSRIEVELVPVPDRLLAEPAVLNNLRGNHWHDDKEMEHGDRSSMQDERGTG